MFDEHSRIVHGWQYKPTGKSSKKVTLNPLPRSLKTGAIPRHIFGTLSAPFRRSKYWQPWHVHLVTRIAGQSPLSGRCRNAAMEPTLVPTETAPQPYQESPPKTSQMGMGDSLLATVRNPIWLP